MLRPNTLLEMPTCQLPIRSFLLLTLCLLFSSCASNDSQQTKTSDGALPPVVATVNGQEISTKLYEMYLKNGKEALYWTSIQ